MNFLNVCSLAVLALAAFSSSAQTFATESSGGNGGGHNGPDLSGPSIPVSVDHLLTKDLFSQAHAKCSLEIAEDLFKQIPDEFLASRRRYFPPLEIDATTLESDGHFRLTQLSHNKNSKEYIEFQFYSNGSNTRFHVPYSLIAIINRTKSETIDVFTTSEPLPYFTFDESWSDTSYDELGRALPNGQTLTHIVLHLPTNYSSAVRLSNEETKVKTNLTLNEEKFVNCILSNIQGRM